MRVINNNYATALSVESVAEEYDYVRETYANYTLELVQTAVHTHNNRNYDVMTLSNEHTGEEFTLYFDITSFFNHPKVANANLDKIIAKKKKEDKTKMHNCHDDLMNISREYLAIYKDIFEGGVGAKDYDSRLQELDFLREDVEDVLTVLSDVGDYEEKYPLLDHANNLAQLFNISVSIIEKLKRKADGRSYNIITYFRDMKTLGRAYTPFETTGNALQASSYKYL